MKKLIFLPLCLSLCLSSLAQAQQPSNQQAMLEQISQLDTKTLAQAIDQLPDNQKEILEKAFESKDAANLIIEPEILKLLIGLFSILALNALLYFLNPDGYKQVGEDMLKEKIYISF